MQTRLLTAESVTEGHPDKLCDQISDALLDQCLKEDAEARVALETMASRGCIMVAGEVTFNGTLDVEKCVRNTLKQIGYSEFAAGLDYKSCLILQNIHQQSKDIALGVDENKAVEKWIPGSCGCRWVKDKSSLEFKKLGAGDQGIVYGYACNETPNLMPLPFELANRLTKALAELRKRKNVSWLYPDGKSQITMRYDENNKPIEITSIVLSAQHSERVTTEYVRQQLLSQIIRPVIPEKWITPETKIHINPTGRFVIGGPAGDTGLTGRKIMVDSYGGLAKNGGGAFSGKDPTKVDRSGAYMARYVAKNIVAAGLAERCEVSIAYAIGLPEPEAIEIDTFGTEKIDVGRIKTAVQKCFNFNVSDVINQLELLKPQYEKTAAYGHFGREDEGFVWENIDCCEDLLDSV